jgi:hypothetical protein
MECTQLGHLGTLVHTSVFFLLSLSSPRPFPCRTWAKQVRTHARRSWGLISATRWELAWGRRVRGCKRTLDSPARARSMEHWCSLLQHSAGERDEQGAASAANASKQRGQPSGGAVACARAPWGLYDSQWQRVGPPVRGLALSNSISRGWAATSRTMATKPTLDSAARQQAAGRTNGHGCVVVWGAVHAAGQQGRRPTVGGVPC